MVIFRPRLYIRLQLPAVMPVTQTLAMLVTQVKELRKIGRGIVRYCGFQARCMVQNDAIARACTVIPDGHAVCIMDCKARCAVSACN